MIKYFDSVLRTTGGPYPDVVVTVLLFPSEALAPIYTDDGSGLIAGSEVTTDARGFFEFFCDPGRYILEFGVDNAIQRTIVNVDVGGIQVLEDLADDDADEGAALISYTPNHTNSVTQPLNEFLDDIVLHVSEFGVVGDDVADDTAALNVASAFLKGDLDVGLLSRRYILDASGMKMKILGSVNFTDFTGGRNWGIRNWIVDAQCTGKVALDFSGSRHYLMENVQVLGHITNTPKVGILEGVSATGGYSASVQSLRLIVKTDGYFTTSAHVVNGCEEGSWVRCTYLNKRLPDGGGPSWAGMLMGTNNQGITSEFVTLPTTQVSFTVNNFLACSWQKPFGLTGDALYINDISSVQFESLYVTSASDSAIVWDLSTNYIPYMIRIQVQIETTGIQRLIQFTGGANARTIKWLDIECGNVYASDELIEVDTLTSLTLAGFRLKLPRWNTVVPTNGVIASADRSKVKIFDGEILVPAVANFGAASDFSEFYGKIADVTGISRTYAKQETFVPVASFSTNGTYTPVYAAQTMQYRIVNGLCIGDFKLVFDNNAYAGASGIFQISLPYAKKGGTSESGVSLGRVSNVTLAGVGDTQLTAYILPSQQVINIGSVASNAAYGQAGTSYFPVSVTDIRLEGSFCYPIE